MPDHGRAAYDLHLHTRWSYDSTAHAAAYLEAARRFGVRVIAITEHHVLDSQAEVRAAADRFPDVRVIRPAELTVHTSIGPVDLLCYGFPPDPPASLGRVLDAYHELQRAYGAAVCRGLRALGLDYTDEQRVQLLRSYRPSEVIAVQGHTHVRNELQRDYFIERGFIASKDDYVPLLNRAAEAVPTPLYPAVGDVAPAVHEAGALVAIAHPHGPFRGDVQRMDLLRDECLLDGIECAHQAVPPEFTPVYRAYCVEHGLFSTAGSDCHHDADIPTALAAHGGPDAWLDEFLERLDGRR